ncbi:ParB/RepB/Spo0J family partition protein [Jiella sp. MQZ9-1]|uniref:ParB/RepB/Spo0J family partition protein n=1 Tax=Jiella flava TaxID=2816857 RepID=A0A939G2C4_9HYPH|nr:ParB/RepB/Spo0J family partition protein [Jiella flava]MBO0664288.1 ParB/RepB/Spo0J family partition protein [Jiella flava]MCD2472789.1 ParB/RepB/Spo0J family partition protein [Jiella flava]
MSEDRSRQRLGRGLASLIGSGVAAPARPVPGFDSQQPATPTVQAEGQVPIIRITPNPHNPRRTFRQDELEELAASIRHHGVVQPLLVRPLPGRDGHFELVAGERRLRAAQLAGLRDVPVVTREINDRQSLEIAIIENVQRADLNAIEEAQGYQALIDEHGYTQADLAEILAKSRSHVANTLRLLKLPAEVRAMVEQGILSAGAARTVVTAADPLALAKRIVAENLSVREAEALARNPDGEDAALDDKPADYRHAKPAKSKARSANGDAEDSEPKSEAILAWERRFRELSGFDVAIDMAGRRPVLAFTLDQLADLDALADRLAKGSSNAGSAGVMAGPRLRSL